jgi:hypothetical protein
VSSNPFDELGMQMAGMAALLNKVYDEVQQLRSKVDRPEWELLPHAAKRRHRDRRTILAAVERGEIACERRPVRGAVPAYFLRVSDLDRLFPVHTKHEPQATTPGVRAGLAP